MKKKMFSIENVLKLTNAKHAIENALKEGKAQELAAALNEALDTIQNAEEEVDENELKAKIEEVLATVMKDAEPNDKTKEAIANAINKRITALRDSVDKSLSVEVKNSICRAILRCSGREEVRDAVNGILTKNGITGLTFEQAVDYTIVENWGDFNPLFKQLKKVPFTKFFYSTQDLKDANILAKQWSKLEGGEKKVQEITVTAKEIRTDYVYKIQRFANVDLDEIEVAGNLPNFLRFINEELDRQIVTTIVIAILLGDARNEEGERITVFETVNKDASDAFTTIVHPTSEYAIENARNAADKVRNNGMKKKVAIMSTEYLTSLAAFKYSETSTPMYRTTDEVAAQLGVGEVIVCDELDEASGVACIFMIPEEYVVREKKEISVSYPKYEKNAMYYQKERNIGGAIHGLLSTSVLKRS